MHRLTSSLPVASISVLPALITTGPAQVFRPNPPPQFAWTLEFAFTTSLNGTLMVVFQKVTVPASELSVMVLSAVQVASNEPVWKQMSCVPSWTIAPKFFHAQSRDIRQVPFQVSVWPCMSISSVPLRRPPIAASAVSTTFLKIWSPRGVRV